jgi:GTP-binding protein
MQFQGRSDPTAVAAVRSAPRGSSAAAGGDFAAVCILSSKARCLPRRAGLMASATIGTTHPGGGKTCLTFSAPSRGLIGYHGEFLSDTRGTGVMNRLFDRYGPYKGPISGRQNGVLISMEQGEAVPYALNALEERGVLFIGPGEKLYEGMVIGENAKPQDLEVNPLKSKQLTNFRSTGKDEAVRLTPPRRMTLEQAIAYIQDDELVEVTPKSIRLRKRYLDPHERKKASRAAA